jgi:hypothetical protein
MPKKEIIHFDVGGTLYKVALTTLMKFPDTMLAALASEKWRQHSADENRDPIFIDRDGELFKYVLAWYRNNAILIPRTVTIGAVENEVKFFSLPDTVVVEHEEISIHDSFNKVGQFTDKKVRFNVGGMPYAISLATLMKFPETMLAKLASEKWSQNSDDGKNYPILMERDGEIFIAITLTTLVNSPEVLLQKLASESWRQDLTDERHNPIIIDRDGKLFKYILAWYHIDTIIIPKTVDIEAMESEGQRLGLKERVRFRFKK